MICLDSVVGVLRGVVHRGWDQLVEDSQGHCCIERSRECLAVNLAARRRSTSAGRLLCDDLGGPDGAVWDVSRGADRKICCAGLTRWLNATVPSNQSRSQATGTPARRPGSRSRHHPSDTHRPTAAQTRLLGRFRVTEHWRSCDIVIAKAGDGRVDRGSPASKRRNRTRTGSEPARREFREHARPITVNTPGWS
jgi:hypothetical protein